MAVRQYVGARYVPKFYENSLGTAEWQTGVAYEPLTIVTYNGNSFTSKKEVPANIGAPNENPAYWASTGIYNAQIDEYREETAEARDLAQKAVGKQLKNARFVFIGDSYAQGYNGTDGTIEANGWPRQIKTMLGLSEDQCYISAEGGAGFSSERGGGGYAAMLTALAESVQDPETIDYVICCGGHNDRVSTTANIYSGIGDFYTAAIAAFPNAKILFGMIAWDKRWDIQNAIINVLRFYHQGNINNAPQMGYLAGVENALYNVKDYIDTDNIHPTAAGNKSIAVAILNALNTGYASNVGPVFDATLTLASGWSMSSGSVPTIASRFKDGSISFATQKMDITRGGNNTIDVSGNGGQIEIGTIDGLIRGGNASDIREWKSITLLIRDITDGRGKYYYVPASIGFSNNKLYLKIYKLTDDGSGWQTLHVNQLVIPQMNFDYNMHT